MQNYLLVLTDKIYLGLLLAAPLGPVSLEMIRRGLASGFWSSFSVRLGGAIANLLCLALTCFGLSQLHKFSALINILGFLGVFLLFYLGYKTISNPLNLDSSKGEGKSFRSGLKWGFYLALFNPVSLAFWPGIFAASLGDAPNIGLKEFLENTFILVGILLWGMGLSSLCSFGRRFFDINKLNFMAKTAGILIILYGVKSCYHMLERLHFI